MWPYAQFGCGSGRVNSKSENGVDKAYDFGTHMAEEGFTPYNHCIGIPCSTKLVGDNQGLQDSINFSIMKNSLFTFQAPQRGFTLGATTINITANFFPTQSGLEIATHLKSEFQTSGTFFPASIIRGFRTRHTL